MKTCCDHFSLRDKKILITGASSGIGKACALLCSKLGAQLILTARNIDRLKSVVKDCRLTDNTINYFQADLSKEEEIISLLNQIDSLDGLVLCAGQVITLPVKFTKIKNIDNILDVNFRPDVIIIQKLLKEKKLKPESSVVGITSILGVTSYMVGNSAYGVSKAALDSWFKYCALENADKKIRFNTIQPGGIITPMGNLDQLTESQIEADIKNVPMRRYGEPREVANAVAFLLSDLASYITGASLIIDGGRHLKY